MKAVLFVLLVLCSFGVGAQSQDSLVWRYADITYPLSGFTSKAKVDVDYGETTMGWFRKTDLLEDSTGKAIKFKSPVDALNWMSVRGWELIQSYKSEQDIGLGTKLEYQHFIMRRKEPRSKP